MNPTPHSLTADSARDTSVVDRDAETVLPPLVEVSRRNGLDPLAARLLELRLWLSDDLAELERAIAAEHQFARPDVAQRSAAHLLKSPGKRIRPLCVLLAARVGGRKLDPPVRHLAVACELVHAATLLHDDVIDLGTERRGQPTARMVFGNSASILGGDFLLISALRLVQAVGDARLLNGMLSVINDMIAAEAIQLERRGRFDPDRSVYLRVVEGKTASLFRWGLEAGGIIAGLDSDTVACLGRIGLAFGNAFQLVDDALDLEGDPHTTGKNAFADLREGKLTWPLIEGAERDTLLAEELRQVVAEPARLDDGTLAPQIVLRLVRTGALQATREHATMYANRALSEARRLADSRARHAIEAVIEAAVTRTL